MATITYISIGANLGDRIGNIEKAINQIDMEVGSIIKRSSIFTTEPVGFSAEEDFLNLCISIKTSLSPIALLNALKLIEQQLGRKKKKNDGVYESRLIDLDIILYGTTILTSKELNIPHEKYHDRMFVLKPLSEIASEVYDPIKGKTIKQLLSDCIDQSTIKFYEY